MQQRLLLFCFSMLMAILLVTSTLFPACWSGAGKYMDTFLSFQTVAWSKLRVWNCGNDVFCVIWVALAQVKLRRLYQKIWMIFWWSLKNCCWVELCLLLHSKNELNAFWVNATYLKQKFFFTGEISRAAFSDFPEFIQFIQSAQFQGRHPTLVSPV